MRCAARARSNCIYPRDMSLGVLQYVRLPERPCACANTCRAWQPASARVGVRTISCYPDNLIDRTIELWQPRLGCELTREDARQIAENVTGFFSRLLKNSIHDAR
jgi:hypothetical protein